MAIKSQQDIKNEQQAKSDKVPPSMEKLKEQPIPLPDINERFVAIEVYLGKVDQAFEKIATDIEGLKNLLKIVQNMDAEISKLTGDVVRQNKLEEDRYIELATAINRINEKVTTLDEYIPAFIDGRIDEYFVANEPANYDDLTEPVPDPTS
jgi:hypothetical protein